MCIRDSRPGGCRRRLGLHRVARRLDRQAHHGALRLPRAAQRPQGRAGVDHRRRARQGALGRARRDRPRPRGRRVRLWHPAAAQGRLHRAGLHRHRCLLDPSAARPGRHHLAVQLPGHGADVVLPDRRRGRQHRGAQAVREGPVRRQLPGRAVEGGRSAGRRLQRRPR